MTREVLLRPTAVLLALLGACRPEPLSEVPVTGGTEEQRALLEAELLAYEQAIGPDRLRLHSVQIVDQLDKLELVGGTYGHKRIRVVSDVDSLTVTLRHELCHALADAENLVNKPDPLFVELAASVFSTNPLAAALIPRHYRTAHKQRSEALAVFCELGPPALIGLLDRCPGQSPLSIEVADWMMTHIYREYPILPPLVLDPARAVTLETRAQGFFPAVSATASPGTVVVAESSEHADWQVQADLYTGSLLDTPAEPVPDVEEGPPVRGVRVYESVGWPEGPAAARGYILPHHLPGGGNRLFVYDPDEAAWRTVDEGCAPPDDDALFTADGQVWRSWTEGGDIVRWMPLLPE